MLSQPGALPAATATVPLPGDCSVVICTHSFDRWDRVAAALASVAAQTAAPAEVVLVVDHNPELAEAARAAFGGVAVVENPDGAGVSGSRNAGIAASTGAVVAFLDDDAVAEPDWLPRLMAPYAEAAVIGVGGFVAPDYEEPPPAWFPGEFRWVLGCSYRGQPTARADVRNAIGANMSFRREVFLRCGTFDEGFGRLGLTPTGCDETELSLRAGRSIPGARIVYEPAAVVRHHVPASRTTWSYFVRRCWGEGFSKALVSAAAGRDGTASERTYVLRTLPTGVARGVADAALHRDPVGLRRAAAIVAGLVVTSANYVLTSARRRLREQGGA